MKLNSYLAQVPVQVKGIPAQIGVISFSSVRGSFSYSAPSDLDYFGYTEMEWELLDRKGYLANWLDKKLSDVDRNELDQEVIQYMRNRHD